MDPYMPIKDAVVDAARIVTEVWRAWMTRVGPWFVSAPTAATVSIAAVNATATLAATGLSASLTPVSKNSRILIVVSQAGVRKDTGDTGVQIVLQRNGATIATLSDNAGKTGTAATNDVGSVSMVWVDKPGVLTNVDYRTMFASKAGVANARVQAGGETSTMVLAEMSG